MKYQGNKNKYTNDILPIILDGWRAYSESGYYVEPFCGSCSVLQHVNGKRIANDKNKYLIAMWKSLIAKKDMPRIIDKAFYDDVRDCFHGKNNRYTDDIIGWVGYMASFNGRFFDGGYSGHNVVIKGGALRDYITENINSTLEQVPFLDGTEFRSCDYRELDIPKNSLIYADPPYKNTKQYQFSKDFNHDEFYDWCRRMVNDGHRLFVSEYNMPDDFECVWSKDVTCALNNTITKHNTEKLFVLKGTFKRTKVLF